MSGSITLFIGPTKAGKTTELQRQYNRLSIKYDKICAINCSKMSCSFFKSYNLESILDEILEFDIILIDNLHLIDDSLEFLPKLADQFGKTIICAGLDTNEQRKPFKNVIDLIPKCEKVQKFSAFCTIKNDTSPAIFSKLVDKKYIPLSRQAYLNKESVGFLHVITGPMFSGKTTELLRQIEQMQSIGKSILTVNYNKDVRYDKSAKICSHNNQSIETKIAVDDLETILEPEILSIYDVIVIDEVQFMKNALAVIINLVDNHQKTVIVSGLDGDFLQNPFGDVCSLIAQADKLTRLNAICKLSKEFKNACFSKRISKETAKELIGAEDTYVAVCRQLYNLPDEQFYKLIQAQQLSK